LLELVRYIHLNPVRVKVVKRPGDWRWSGRGEYLGNENRGLIEAGPVMEEVRAAARYEAFIREGVKEGYRAEWHPGDAPFLGSERFVKKMVKEKMPPAVSRRVSLGKLLHKEASGTGLDPQSLKRKGRTAKIVEARDSFICKAVPGWLWTALVVIAIVAPGRSVYGQALEPRSYVNTPVGINFLLAGYGYTQGNVAFASSPIKDAKVHVNSGVLGYARSLDVWGPVREIRRGAARCQGVGQRQGCRGRTGAKSVRTR
jgi:hypothetical protein